MINLTNKVWKKKFSQLIKDGKLQKDFGESFLAKLDSKVKQSQKKYDTFIKIISKSKKKKKSKKQQSPVSNKVIVEFTLETFSKTNKIWAKGFKKLIKKEKLSANDGHHFLANIEQRVKEYWETYLKDMGTVISDTLGKKSKKEEANSPKKAFDSILGMISLAKDSWKKKQVQAKDNSKKPVHKKQTEEPEKPKKDVTERTESLEIHEKRIQDLELKVSLLLQEVGIIKKICKETTPKDVPAKKTIAKQAPTIVMGKKEIISTKANPNSEKDNFKKIEGIGPKIESLLHDAGILSFTQLSDTKAAAVKAILAEAGSRFKMHNPTTWGQQATLAAKGNWEALKKWQNDLKGGK